MCERCNILCCKKDRRRGPCNEVRIIEFLLCMLCMVCAIIATSYDHFDERIYWFFVPFFAIPITFAFITFIDIIVTWAFFPIGWRAWILFSVGAALLFFFLVGLSPLLTTWLFFLYTILYVITAIVFLMDGLCIVSMISIIRLGQDPKGPCCNAACGIHRGSQIVPYADLSNSFTQTGDPAQAQNYRGPSVGDVAHPHYSQQQPYYGKYHPEREVHQSDEVAADAEYVFPAAAMMMGEPCPPPDAIKTIKPHHKKYKDIDMTPLKNPFIAKSEYKS